MLWLFSDVEDLSTSELVAGLGLAAGSPVRLAPCPRTLLHVIGRLTGRRAEVDRLLGSLTVDSTPLRSAGWTPPFTVEEGLRETVLWWRDSRDRTGS